MLQALLRVVPWMMACCVYTAYSYASPANGLDELEQRVAYELNCIYYPGQEWLTSFSQGEQQIIDVVIVGGGQAGLATAVALQKVGITNIKVLDANPLAYEGPWATYARMHQLRSDKNDAGPSLGIPSLTFRAWYEAQYGSEAWWNLQSPPTHLWMDYLRWYRQVMAIPLDSNVKVVSIESEGSLLRLTCQSQEQPLTFLARKVVLATGRLGFGRACTPEWLLSIPRRYYALSSEEIDFAALAGKKVAVLGVGASAFDAAAVAMEHGATSVHLLMRRTAIPSENRLADISSLGFLYGFYHLSDKERWHIISYATEHGVPPPKEAIDRLQHHSHVNLHADTHIERASISSQKLKLQTNKGELDADYLIVACGFEIDGEQRPELAPLIPHMLLWKHRIDIPDCSSCQRLASSPYLGPSFQFVERYPGQAPFLNNIYCFNYGALLSHGLVCAVIDGVSIGATKLAEGIAADFFVLLHHSPQSE